MEELLSALLQDKGSKVQSIGPNLSVFECAGKMTELKVGALLVLEADNIKGIISERDILRKIVAAGLDSKKTTVAAIMTEHVITVTPATTLREAMQIVTDKRIRHLPVLDNGKLVGLISIGDLTRWSLKLQEQHISSLTNYIQGS